MPKRRRSATGADLPVSDHGAGDEHHAARARLDKGTDMGKGKAGAPEPGAGLSGGIDLSGLISHQEVFLRILGFLSAGELAGVQGVNRYWQAMSLDQQLWKRLYLAQYPHPHHTRLQALPPTASPLPSTPAALSSSHASTSRAGPTKPRSRSFRPIARLPSRAFPPPSPSPSPARARSPLFTPKPDEINASTSAVTSADELHGEVLDGASIGTGYVGSEGKARVQAGKGTATPFVRPALPALPASSRSAVGSGEAPDGKDRVSGEIPQPHPRSDYQSQEIGSGVRHEGVDWKMMLRLGTNWSTGMATRSETITLPPSPSPSAAAASDVPDTSGPGTPSSLYETGPGLDAHGSGSGQQGTSQQHLALSPHFIFTSSPASPLVQVYRSNNGSKDLTSTSTTSHISVHLGIIPPPPGWSNPHRPDNVSTIATDESIIANESTADPLSSGASRPARLVICYRSGGIVILRVSSTPSARLQWVRESVLPPSTRPASIRRRATTYVPLQGDEAVLVSLHWPVLITCTRAFHLSIYKLVSTTKDMSPSRPMLLKTLHSDVSFHPASLSLLPSSSDQPLGTAPISGALDESKFKAALTYCTPVYPSSWTIAVQELDIDLAPSGWVSSANLSAVSSVWTASGSVHRASLYNVSRDPFGSDDEEDQWSWPRIIRPISGVKGAASGIGSDGRWCVLAGRDEQIEVFALPAPVLGTSGVQSNQTAKLVSYPTRQEEEEITHVQTLRLQIGVSALQLQAGKCVVAGQDGRVVVWDLDRLAAEEVGEHSQTSAVHGQTMGFVEISTGRKPTPVSSKGLLAQPSASQPRRAAATTVGRRDGNGEEPGDSGTEDESEDEDSYRLPHPLAISAAARALFLPLPPMPIRHSADAGDGGRRDVVHHVAFDEEKIVGMVRLQTQAQALASAGLVPAVNRTAGEGMKVWSFA